MIKAGLGTIALLQVVKPLPIAYLNEAACWLKMIIFSATSARLSADQ